MPDNSPCTCPVVWAFAPQAATITPGCPVHDGATRSAHYNEAVKAAAVAISRTFNGDPLTWRAEAEAAVEAALPYLRAYQIELQTRIGFQLGRKEAAEEIAAALAAEQDLMSSLPVGDPAVSQQARLVIPARASAFRDAAKIARDIGKGDPT